MDDITMNAMQMLTSYGALGVCTMYFMMKDWVRGKKTDAVIDGNTEAIKNFTVAMNLFLQSGK